MQVFTNHLPAIEEAIQISWISSLLLLSMLLQVFPCTGYILPQHMEVATITAHHHTRHLAILRVTQDIATYTGTQLFIRITTIITIKNKPVRLNKHSSKSYPLSMKP